MRVPREEMQRREAEYKKQSDANPNKRGPKRGSKKKRKAATPPSASGHEATET